MTTECHRYISFPPPLITHKTYSTKSCTAFFFNHRILKGHKTLSFSEDYVHFEDNNYHKERVGIELQ